MRKIPTCRISHDADARGYIDIIMSRCKSHTKVVAYRLDGTLYRIFNTAKEASIELGAYQRTIDKCIRGDNDTAFSYMWRRYEEGSIPSNITPYQKQEIKSFNKPIALVDDNGDIIHYYLSIKKASLDNDVDPHSIRDVLKGKYKSAKGKKYRYLTEDEIRNLNLKNK